MVVIRHSPGPVARFRSRLVLLTCVADNARSTRTSVNALRPPAYFVTVHPTITEQTKRAPDLESRDPALAIECIHKQLSHIPSTLATKSQSMRRNVLDVDADAVPAQRVRRVDRGDGQLELAHDRQDGDGERGVSARGRAQQHLGDAATIVHSCPQRGKYDALDLA